MKSAFLAFLYACWMSFVQAFQVPTSWKRQLGKTNFYRSLSGLFASSSSTLSSLAGGARAQDVRMIAMDPRILKSPFWILPAWMPFATAPVPTTRIINRVSTPDTAVGIPTDEQIEVAKLQIQKRHQARKYEEEHLRGMHVAGFMDYDPKVGARNAYRVAMKSGSRRDNGWFHL